MLTRLAETSFVHLLHLSHSGGNRGSYLLLSRLNHARELSLVGADRLAQAHVFHLHGLERDANELFEVLQIVGQPRQPLLRFPIRCFQIGGLDLFCCNFLLERLNLATLFLAGATILFEKAQKFGLLLAAGVTRA